MNDLTIFLNSKFVIKKDIKVDELSNELNKKFPNISIKLSVKKNLEDELVDEVAVASTARCSDKVTEKDEREVVHEITNYSNRAHHNLMPQKKFVNGYKVCSFNNNGIKEYLVLDVVADVEKRQATLQGFRSDGSCLPFVLFFSAELSGEDLLKEALLDGTSHVKEVERWQGSECEENLDDIASSLSFLGSIKEHCKSEKLASDIDQLLGNA